MFTQLARVFHSRQAVALLLLLLLNNATRALELGEETIPPGEDQQIVNVQNAVATLMAACLWVTF